MWALIRYSESLTWENAHTPPRVRKLDIDLCNEQGFVCVRMKGFSAQTSEGETGPAEPSSAKNAPDIGTLIFEPCWKEKAVASRETAGNSYARWLVILCEPGGVSPESLPSLTNGPGYLVLQ